MLQHRIIAGGVQTYLASCLCGVCDDICAKVYPPPIPFFNCKAFQASFNHGIPMTWAGIVNNIDSDDLLNSLFS